MTDQQLMANHEIDRLTSSQTIRGYKRRRAIITTRGDKITTREDKITDQQLMTDCQVDRLTSLLIIKG